MGKESKTREEEMADLINAMKAEASLTESDFKHQDWQFNPCFQKASEIKEVEDGNQSIQSIESDDHSHEESE